MQVNLEDLAAVIEQLDKTDFTEFRYEQGDFRLHVTRDGVTIGGAPAQTSAPTQAPTSAPTEVSTAASTPVASASPAVAPAASGNGLDPDNLPAGHVAVTAPMLGTVYSAPKPGAAPFVQVGDRVEAGTTVCIIEVMKLMNNVPSDTSGEVVAVFVQDGDLVEHGQPIMALKV